MTPNPDSILETPLLPRRDGQRHDARTWFITGASSGLGSALAECALLQGDCVVLAARSIDALRSLASSFPGRALAVAMDVTDRHQRAAAIEHALAHFGGIDVLVNNAGIDFLGAIEEQREADYRAQFEVNFFGPVEMIRLVLPGMRDRGTGTIVNISSMDGLSSLPANGYYSSSKFALEGLTEALWQEIQPLGLRALLVEPGSFRTGIEHRTRFSGAPIAAYEATSGAFRNLMGTLTPDMFPGDPARAAAAVFEVVTAQPERHWVVLGSDAQRRIRAKLELLQAELEIGEPMAMSTDFPGSGRAVL
ncbi:SDR family NAD(P)-dependent oxidoreductase [Lysobacter sp. GCM10012299]|uniref:SDR family NAD(P)-dependent oxidoreductase n=1 Tax=Lysobacter sp. GCM10012299 TaxID=3317333 RepID=UPI00362202FB